MAEANNFTMDTVLLGSESVGGEGCGKELKVHGQEKVEALAANEKLNIGQNERSGVRWFASILTRTHEVEKGNADHVSDG